ncbi:MAG: MBOAT family O-acyltransferase, partial [Flavobacteriales bacterium]
LAASYYFYGCWDWRFLFLLAFSTVLDYVSGLRIHGARTAAGKRAWLVASMVINLGFLGLFKYYDFFAESFAALMANLGLSVSPPLLKLILPVGISFYTFHGLSYVFDIYHGRIAPNREPVTYALFVAFFPLLVAGPIERATHLLPQLQRPRVFDASRAADGCRQILWGLFKKMVIADRAAILLNPVFEAPGEYSGSTIAWAAVLFAFQIYGDFSGYSDIALGTARLLGIELLRNFSFPYFSRDIAEFWRRWHITLGSWFRDYVYLPLGGGLTRGARARNLLATFALSGLWHGANWTFPAWGLLHGAYHLPMVAAGARPARDDPSWRDLHRIAFTALLVTIAWVLFRATSLQHASDYLIGMARNAMSSPGAALLHVWRPEMLWAVAMLAVEWRARRRQHALEAMPAAAALRWVAYLLLALLIIAHIDLRTPHAFIYFQF